MAYDSDLDRGLDVCEAAADAGVSVSYLNKMRLSGDGPAFYRLGRRVIYTRRELRRWREGRRFKSTSEYTPSAA